MPRYYFNVHDGVETIDKDGTVLADLRAAKKMALSLAAGLIEEQEEEFWNGESWRVQVVDDTGTRLCAVYFSGLERALTSV